MKNTLLYLLTLFSCAAFAQEIVLPDANFKAKLLGSDVSNGVAYNSTSNPIAIDANGDGILTQNEADAVYYLNISSSGISSLDGVAYFTNLKGLYCGNNMLSTLDLGANINLIYLSCSNNNLETLFIKNGSNEDFPIDNWNGNPNLSYICADESQVNDLVSGTYNVPNTVQVNSYCTYAPGGLYNKITGTVRYDATNNGCDASDAVVPSLRMKISNGVYEDDVFTNADGTYTFYVGAGNYTVTPNFEENYFTASPVDSYVNFAALTESEEVRNFCVAASAASTDVEVVMAPLSSANVNSDVQYKIVYKNKGNQTVSGTVTCNWDGSLFEFVSMSPMADFISTTVYSWNYMNLKPFECKEIVMTLHLNGPSDTPAVYPGYEIPFTMSITSTGDVIPSDNSLAFNQRVITATETNTITCIEGETVSPDKIGEYLHYVVNFKNTGTQSADFVVIEADIDTDKFDLSSLRLLNNSIPVKTRIAGGRVLFRFDTSMEVADHGNILYKIKTKKSLMQNDRVSNVSAIYYGYNFPIITNDASTTFALLSKGEFTIDTSVKIYPNPTNNFVKVDSEGTIKSVQIFDIQGRLLQHSFVSENSVILDVSDMPSGMYFVKVLTEKGIKVEKLIRE